MKLLICLFIFKMVCEHSFAIATIEHHHEEENIIHDHDDEEDTHPFENLVAKTNSQIENKLDLPSLREVLHNFELKCLSAEGIFDALDIESNAGLDEEQFETASLLIVYDLIKTSNNCTENYTDVNTVLSELFENDSQEISQEDIEQLLESIRETGKYNPYDANEECFGTSTLLSSRTSDESETKNIVMRIVINIANGLCILPSSSYFRDQLVEYIGASQTQMISETAFNEFLEKFNIGQLSSGQNDHDHDDDSDDEHDAHDDNEHDDHDDEHDEQDDGLDGHDDEHDDHDDEHEDEFDDHNDEHEDDENAYIKIESQNRENAANTTKRNTDVDNTKPKCYSSSELFAIAGPEMNTNGEPMLSVEGLLSICPAILQQFVTNACQQEHSDTDSPQIDTTYTTDKKYGYGTLAVFLISLLAFGGLVLFPTAGSLFFKMTMQFFIALGVGSLSGDALLHLIPEIVGLHGHSEGESHDHDEEEEDKTYLYKLLVVISGLYLFYLFENILRLYNQVKGKKISFHQHDHNGRKHSHAQPGKEAGSNHMVTRASISIVIDAVANETKQSHDDNHENKLQNESRKNDNEKENEKEDENKNPEAIFCGITPIGIMVFIGDTLHNFGDGLALGVAFSSSLVAGVGASIAIFCHELPHEFGDFAIYLKNGLSKWKALGLNFLAACFAFIGLYVGLSVGQDEDARQWMLAVIAGMFLYIALVDVLHEMIEEVSKDHPVLLFVVQNVGLISGWITLFVLALYEDELRTAIQ